MATAPKQPRIVAELGRPETPEETAARKAENTRLHRTNQTTRNLVLSLIATLGVLLVITAFVVRQQPGNPRATNWHTIAAQAQVDAPSTLADPQLPSKWTANNATFTTSSDKISTWYIGFVTPKITYVGFKQGVAANATWVAQQLDQRAATGVKEIDGVSWDIYNHRNDDDPGNLAYAMTTTVGDSSLLVYGTASTSDIETVATAALEALK